MYIFGKSPAQNMHNGPYKRAFPCLPMLVLWLFRHLAGISLALGIKTFYLLLRNFLGTLRGWTSLGARV